MASAMKSVLVTVLIGGTLALLASQFSEAVDQREQYLAIAPSHRINLAPEQIFKTPASNTTPGCAISRDSYLQGHFMLLSLCRHEAQMPSQTR